MLNINANILGAKGKGLPQLSFTTEETSTFSGEIRMTEGDVKVNWGDGTAETVADGDSNLSHDYSGVTGTKKITFIFTKGYKDVTELDLNGQDLSGNLSAVSNLTSLSYLRLNDTNVSGDLSAVSNLTSLSYLYLYDTKVSGDLSAVSNLTSLSYLYLNDTNVSGDLSTVSNLTSLIVLRLNDINVSGDLSAVSNLTSLSVLRLNDTNVSGDLSAVSNLTSLNLLYLDDTSINTYTSTTLPGDDWDDIEIQIQNLPELDASECSQILIDLDDGGSTGGTLDMFDNNGGSLTYADLTSAGQTAHDNLVNNKSYTITLDT